MRNRLFLTIVLLICLFVSGCISKSPELPLPTPNIIEETTEIMQVTPTSAVAELARFSITDIFIDFTIELPSNFDFTVSFEDAILFVDGVHAGHIRRGAYYPENGYGDFIGNHNDLIGGWEEADIDFTDNGQWRSHIERVVLGHFLGDDREDHFSGRSYEHTAYYIILEDKYTLVNGFGDELTYQVCYELDFVTARIDETGIKTHMMSEADIKAAVQSFAMNTELPYMPTISFNDMEELAIELIREALYDADTPEEKQMYAALGSPETIENDELHWSSAWFEYEENKRTYAMAYEAGNTKCTVKIDMDTGEPQPPVFEIIPG